MIYPSILTALCLVLPFTANAQSRIMSKRDTLSISQCEFVIGNASRDVKGFLFNTGNGKTAFYGTGKAVQFAVGTQNAPAAGDSLYTNIAFRQRCVKVWRNGIMQSPSDLNGIRFNPETGIVNFYPSLAQNDQILIEAISIIEE